MTHDYLMAAAVALPWLALGWLGARLALLDWRRTFGGMDGAPYGIAAVLTAIGPMGLVIGSAIWLTGVDVDGKAARIWGIR